MTANNTPASWKTGQSYKPGDLVIFGGVTYTALQAETSIATWAPNLAATLWAPVTAPVIVMPPPATPATGPAWSAAAVYTAGMRAYEAGVVYQANWWTQGNDPAKSSGVAGSGQPWTVIGPGTLSGDPQPPVPQPPVPQPHVPQPPVPQPPVPQPPVPQPPVPQPPVPQPPVPQPPVPQPPVPPPSQVIYAPTWKAGSVYQGGADVAENGIVYQANWWTQGDDPAKNSGTGLPWTVIGTLKPVTVVPTTPTNLVAAGVMAHSASIYWTGSVVPGGGELTDYVVYQNGIKVATTTDTAYTASNLTAGASYSFTVAAEDVAGASAVSVAKTVTTVAPGASPVLTPTFAPYIDVGLAADDDFVAISQGSGTKELTLAFLQSSGPGKVGWSGVGTLNDDQLANGTTIQQQIQALRAVGGDVIISFGGESGTDPATIATSVAQLQAEYQSVIDHYQVNSLDFDIEGGPVADAHGISMRDQALVALKAANPGLTISYTLPVLPDGLDNNGRAVLAAAKSDGLKLDVVNIMAMDYGANVDHGGQMGLDAISAAQATLAQIQAAGLTAKVGITPMIGVNDTAGETFTLADAAMLEAFAKGNPNVARLAMWSIARDNGGTPGAHYASPDSSGVAQTPYEFSSIFKAFGS